MTTEQKVANILNKVIYSTGKTVSSNDERIFELGLIDSFGILELVTALEETFNIKISYGDMTIQNFSSIRHIARLMDSLIMEEQPYN